MPALSSASQQQFLQLLVKLRHICPTHQISVSVSALAKRPVCSRYDTVDYYGAVDIISESSPAVGEAWRAAIANVTTVNATALSYSPTPYLLPELGKPQPVPEDVALTNAAEIASGECVPLATALWSKHPAAH